MAGKEYPPECWEGTWDYEWLKERLNNPKHEKLKEMKEWIGIEDVNNRVHPEEFDPDSVNEMLSEIW